MDFKKSNIISYIALSALLLINYKSFNNTVKANVSPNYDNVKKIIYLTFDDGPSTTADIVLDILKQKNVKATFFLIGNQIKDNETVVKRMHDEGHSIGLHTFTHRINKIYLSEDAFINEMDYTQKEVFRVTGIKSTIIRFPSGSKNHLNEDLLQKLNEHNYKVYDWNAVVTDGLNVNTSPIKLFRQATCIKNKPNPMILLMHCNYVNKNTCKALPEIIDYYKNEGYTFKIITNDTPEYYSRIRKR